MFAEFARFTVKTDTQRFLSLRAEAVRAVMHAPGSGEFATGGVGTGGQCP